MGPDPLADALAASLTRRARAVRAEGGDAARAAIARRLERRARRRRHVALAITAAAVAATSALLAVRDPGQPGDVVAADGNPGGGTAAGPSPTSLVPGASGEPGASGDDPRDFGLPRLHLDTGAGAGAGAAIDLQALPGDAPVVTTAAAPAPWDGGHVQVLRPDGALLPVILVPWRPEGPARWWPTPGGSSRTVRVGDAEAVLDGGAPGWLGLSWTLSDGSEGRIFGYGVTAETLVATAAGLRRPAADQPGYVVDHLPPGFRERTVTAPVGREVTALYTLPYRITEPGSGTVHRVELRVGSGGRHRMEERLARLLAPAGATEVAEVMGQPALVVRSADGSWVVWWSPEPGVGAELTVSRDAPRSVVDAVVATLATARADRWDEILADTGVGE